VAASFALAGEAAEDRFVYAFALPYAHDNVSFHYSEEIAILNLRNLMSPVARRPHFQEGYLVGSVPAMKFTVRRTGSGSLDTHTPPGVPTPRK
jgi:hypothetical protein